MGDPRVKSLAAGGVVRVDFPSERMTKKMQFDYSATVGATKELVLGKLRVSRPMNSGSELSDYSLFLPPSGDTAGAWMKDEEPLNYYMIEQRGVVEFRMRPRPIKVSFELTAADIANAAAAGGAAAPRPRQMDTEADFTAPVANVALKFAVAMGLPRPTVSQTYVLRYAPPGSPVATVEAIEPTKSLLEAAVPYGATVVLQRADKPGTSQAGGSGGGEGAGKGRGGLKAKAKGKAMFKTMRKGGSGGSSGSTGTAGGSSGPAGGASDGAGGAGGAQVFGQELSRVAVGGSVPLVDDAIAYVEKVLDHEGIFRLSGSATEIQALKKRVDAGERVDLSTVRDPHVVCGLLKLYLREMPEPLFTWVNYDPLLAIDRSRCGEETQLRWYKALICGLPALNRNLLQKLLIFQQHIIQHEAQNKMPVHNVSTVFAPNLLKSIEEGALPIVEDTGNVLSVTQSLIRNADALFDDAEEFSSVAVAIYDFATEKDYELTFQKGDVIFVVAEDDSGWWRGEHVRTGQAGVFPSNYVEVSQVLRKAAPPAAEESASSASYTGESEDDSTTTATATTTAAIAMDSRSADSGGGSFASTATPTSAASFGAPAGGLGGGGSASFVQARPKAAIDPAAGGRDRSATQQAGLAASAGPTVGGGGGSAPKAGFGMMAVGRGGAGGGGQPTPKRGGPGGGPGGGGGMSKEKFTEELDSLRTLCEAERAARVDLERVADEMQAELAALRDTVANLRSENDELRLLAQARGLC